jgi:glycosyltransferase involved in cell wall biosynthesis
MKILQLTPFFYPNIGGVETHLLDLTSELSKKKIFNYVLTYQPLMSNIQAKEKENLNDYVFIHRIPILRNVFIKIEKFPLFDFLYLTPKLFINAVLLLISNQKFDLIHAHGLNATFIAYLLNKLFKIPYVTSTHVLYSFKKDLMQKISRIVYLNSAHIFALSNFSKRELIGLGIPESKISVYRYWVDQDIFKIRDKKILRKDLNLFPEDFIVFFAGRLIEKKGIIELIDGFNLIDKNLKIKLIVAGTGPCDGYVKDASKSNSNILYLGGLDAENLKKYYSLSDVLIIPSTHDEGFGRVILEALSSGIPVLGSNRGGIVEAITPEVGMLFDVSKENIFKSILEIKKFIELKGAKNLEKTCRDFAEKNYSCDNINVFINEYGKIIK